MSEFVYLDNSATTKPSSSCIENVNKALCENWGNPSSLHVLGMNAEDAVNEVRKKAAKLLRCADNEIYFTSCGTESNNTAIFSAVFKGRKRGKRIVTTAVEHPSVLEPLKILESEGFEVIRLKPDSSGRIREEDIFAAVDKNTILVSIMLCNNETGAIMPVSAAKNAIKSVGAPALLHCDAVQAFGKMDIDVAKLGVDMLTFSGHKIHGPKGVGGLYIKKGTALRPYISGGGQEKNMRSGTESVPLIMGLGGAMDDLGNIAENLKRVKELNLKAREILKSTNLIEFNSDENSLPYILNISVPSYRSETLLHFLESKKIYVSSGSACAKGEGSYVLNEMGLDRKRVDSALRISFSRFNTQSDIEKLVDALIEAAAKIRKAN